MDDDRLKRIEDKTDRCIDGLNKCSSSVVMLKQQLDTQNQLTRHQLEQMTEMLEIHQIVLNGNPRQDTKDRGMIGDVEQLKSTDARKKKLYWLTLPAVMALLVTSFWNSMFGKEDHGRSETTTETKVNKTGPGSQHLRIHNRSDREGL